MKALKSTFLYLAIATIVIACQGGGSSSASADKLTTPLQQRRLLIKELNRLKAGLASDNKDSVASFFNFPVADSMLSFYMQNSKEFSDADTQLTRPLFLKHYASIMQHLGEEDMNQLFAGIKPDSLLHKDTLEYEWSQDTISCARIYNITIENDKVTLSMRLESNPSYNAKTNAATTDSTGDDEDMGDGCEYGSFVIFRFDGMRLSFVRMAAAG